MFKSINKIIRFLIYSDFVFNSAWGLLGPVFAIFIVQSITVGSATEGAKVVGFATFFYWVVKSILQIPLSKIFDKRTGERDDFWFMFFGLLITGLVPFGYLISYLPWHIYMFQIIQAIGMAMHVPSWFAIFTRHIDKGREAYEWGLNSTLLGFGIGITGAIGGLLVAFFGFKIIFILAGSLNIFSALLFLLIHKDILPRDRIFPYFPFIKRRQF